MQKNTRVFKMHWPLSCSCRALHMPRASNSSAGDGTARTQTKCLICALRHSLEAVDQSARCRSVWQFENVQMSKRRACTAPRHPNGILRRWPPYIDGQGLGQRRPGSRRERGGGGPPQAEGAASGLRSRSFTRQQWLPPPLCIVSGRVRRFPRTPKGTYPKMAQVTVPSHHARTAYLWHQLGAGPLPIPPARPPLGAPEGLPPHWPWEATFLHTLLQWAGALLWLPGQGQVTYVELALDSPR